MLLPAWAALSAGAAAEAQDDGPQEREEERSEVLVEELSRALGMTPAEIEALELSPAEMRSLIAGFTEETVVVGSRAEPRSATDSAVPVDVLTATDLVSQGSGDLKDQLRTIIPSFSVNTQPISGVATVVRPAMLRNLAPDHTLVLINGKRRHRSSIVDYHGGNGVAFGSQGPDISAIPAIALRQVEVLRDGAAAQYGSDAIAGVLNFQLKDARAGGSVELNTGLYRAGDGESTQFRRQRRPAARRHRVRQPQPGVRQREPDEPSRAASRCGCAHRGRQYARTLRPPAGSGAIRTSTTT